PGLLKSFINKPLSLIAGVVVALVVTMMIWMAVSSKNKDESTAADDEGVPGAEEAGTEGSTPRKSRKKKAAPEFAAERPQIKTVVCNVMTP
ncbi:MAG TPA: hypothetical protein VGH74_22110, partial [Planctomycetaceae bacterium]